MRATAIELPRSLIALTSSKRIAPTALFSGHAANLRHRRGRPHERHRIVGLALPRRFSSSNVAGRRAARRTPCGRSRPPSSRPRAVRPTGDRRAFRRAREKVRAAATRRLARARFPWPARSVERESRESAPYFSARRCASSASCLSMSTRSPRSSKASSTGVPFVRWTAFTTSTYPARVPSPGATRVDTQLIHEQAHRVLDAQVARQFSRDRHDRERQAIVIDQFSPFVPRSSETTSSHEPTAPHRGAPSPRGRACRVRCAT